MFIGGTDANAETPILWLPHAKSWLFGKDSDAGRDWGQEEMEMTEDEMAGWHHQLNGHEFGWTPRVGNGQGSLACCNSWDCKESDTTELNWTELNGFFMYGLWAKNGLIFLKFVKKKQNKTGRVCSTKLKILPIWPFAKNVCWLHSILFYSILFCFILFYPISAF